ncbi:DNA polymerase III subunit alpha [Streptomyces sp. Ru87]|uniref:DNA polymerase III subunit alpha n=1 Tax=Streptomyces sp. Ru87 TaxID=2044307 RepID=UPI000BF86EEB|nr:DNA polymerase III subunit alpha [Streptomyces sp. Ru87]PGH51120.1 DNA polymerase III subunit alpha [Streptomyces sp. Ru87]
MSGFTHLHTVSGFSMRYGATHPERLAVRAAERGMDAVALTDRDTLAGTVRFARACARAGVRPVFGANLAVAESLRSPLARSGARSGAATHGPDGAHPGAVRRRSPVRGGAFIDESAPRALFLARDGAAGWAALCRLVSAAHADGGERPLLHRPDLERSAVAEGGLTVLLGPGSEVGRALAAGRPDRAAGLLAPWREIYGDALRLEVVHHRRPGEARGTTAPGSLRLAARTLGFAAEQGVPAVLTNAVRYADPGQGPVADVLDAARRLVPVDPRKPGSLDSGERWLKDPDGMAETAGRIAEAAGFRRDAAHRLLAETERTAAACLVDPEDDIGLGTVHFPEPRLVGAGRRTADRVLRSRCAAGMVLRGHDRDRRRWERLEDELRIIERLGFASYFLTVAQVVDDTRALGVRVAARGSGAGSLVNHLLGIANADPVEHDLLMERFLSERRAALPDIDIDVESARRLDVYRAVFDRFGADRVATVAMPETYRVRHAVRDVGAALGMDPAETDRLAKAFPHIRARDARAALDELPELRSVAAERDRYGRLWELVEALDGLPRGIAMHPCGVLLSDVSMRDRTPVVTSAGSGASGGVAGAGGFPMSQFDKDDVEELGLLKLDILGVRMQSAMAHAVTEIERASGERVDLDGLVSGPSSPKTGRASPKAGEASAKTGGASPETGRPAAPMSDPATYDLIKSTETLGCFQIESPGQRDLVGRLQPATFHDLVVDISLFRPGPVAADMVRPFIEARHGRRAPRYPHPDLEPVLRETYGVVVFHEQVIGIVSVMTGCDRGLADEARRALSDPERQGRVRAWFAREAAGRGYAPEVVARTWEIVEAFGSYGFCKAHAVAFAVPTYQSAWLKAHHPAAFYAGLLTHDPGMYPKRLLLADARRRGVPVLPLDVNRSGSAYRIELVSGEKGKKGEKEGERYGIRLALSDVHGISEAETGRIEAGQPYASLLDLWRRARPGRPVAERLAQVGALDAFGGNRRDLLLRIAELHRRQKDPAAHTGQLPLDAAAGPDGAGVTAAEPAGLPDLDAAERTGAELGVLGMDVSRHLMTDHAAFLEELGATPAKRLRAARHGETVLVAGAKAATQTPAIRSGRRIIFTTLDDGTGLADCTFFEDSHAACAHTVFHSWLLLVRGTVERRGARSLTVVGTRAWNLAELAELRREGGLRAVAERLAGPEGTADGGERTEDGGEPAEGAAPEDAAAAGVNGRRIQLPTGYEMHPWSDLRPAGEGAATGRKLWHSSPGSAGR